MNKKLGALLAIAPLSLGLAACGDSGSDSENETVRIGVVKPDVVNEELEKVAEENGIDIEYVELSDYQQPNPQLSSGQLDMNWFQHIAFLAEYNVNSDDDLQIVGPTAIYPLGLYSNKHASVEDIPEGGEVAIPNDSVNETRAILVLKAAGLVELKEDKASPAITDVDTDKSKVSLKSVDAAQTVLALDSVDASVVNNDFVADAGLEPSDAIYEDDPSNEEALPYVNLFAAKKGEEDNETYQKIAELYHDDRVQEKVKEQSGGTAVDVTTDVSELREVQSKLEDELRNQ